MPMSQKTYQKANPFWLEYLPWKVFSSTVRKPNDSKRQEYRKNRKMSSLQSVWTDSRVKR